MSNSERQIIRFADTGVGLPTAEIDRVPLTDGMVFVAKRIEIRPSLVYGYYVTFDGETLDGEEFHGYSPSCIILQQVRRLLEKYGGKDGTLTVNVLCEVRVIISEKTGRRVYTLV